MNEIYSWQADYLAAVCETDDSLMEGRILVARSSIEQRLLSPIENEEALEIRKAAECLEILRAERLDKAFTSHLTSKPSQPQPQALSDAPG